MHFDHVAQHLGRPLTLLLLAVFRVPFKVIQDCRTRGAAPARNA
jgi:hypothetical protein